MSAQFVHLHNHSEYSTLDGASRIEELVGTAQKMGMPAVALTDHGSMFGAVELYLACQKASKSAEKEGLAPIKAIVGMEAYIVPDGKKRADRVLVDGEYARHLVLWAQDLDGYRNLMKLASIGYLEGFYYKPRIDKEILAECSKGIVATSTDIGGEIPQAILRGDVDEARRLAGVYMDIFGRENYYFEIQDHGMAEEKTINAEILKMAKEFDRPVIATNDIHYTSREDARAHDVLLCIQTGKLLSDEKRLRFPNDQFYMKTPDEMAEIFAPYCPEAVTNTLEVAERINLEIPTGTYHHPQFPIPEGRGEIEYFRELVHEGLHRRFGDPVPAEAKERAEMELGVIERMKFVGYLLIVWDLVRHAREIGIPVGPGRGSAAGSLVCYALGITDINPFDYDLIFERFINEGRNEMPDIDLDFCQERRPEMLQYVAERYGRENVSQIITFARMAARAAIRDVGRVLGIPLPEVDRIAKTIPTGPGQKLQDALDKIPEFAEIYNGNETYRELIDVALRVEGLVRQPGTHAAGVVIADKPLVEYCPLYKASGDDTVCTQYHMKLLDPVGLLKVDFLGLQTLTVIHHAVELVRRNKGVDLEMDKIPLDDARVYEMLSRGESKGIFQFESDGMKRLLQQARPDRFDDLIALNAMYRPGPMENISSFVSRKHGREPVTYPHPKIKPILESTYGIIVYQEQVMRIANVLGGFSLSEADTLRYAMGKKDKAIMAEYKGYFVDGCIENGMPAGQARELGDLIASFARYGFNKSHSAAYANVAYQTGYLKANYPTEFMAALLTLDMRNTDKVVEYIEEARRIGVEVQRPDINKSGAGFEVVADGVIQYALAALKGVGARAVESLVQVRNEDGPFRDIYELCERIDTRQLNRGALDSMVKAGALDSLGAERSRLIAVLDDALATGSARSKDRARGQATMFDVFGGDEPEAPASLPDIPEWDRPYLLEQEKAVLGFYLTHHPLDPYRRLVEQLSTAPHGEIADLPRDTPVTLGGMIASVRPVTTRKGDRMLILQIEGFANASCEAIVFPQACKELGDSIQVDAILFVQGVVREGRQGKNIAIENVVPMDQARAKLVDRVVGTIHENDPEAPARLDAFHQLAAAHPGDAKLALRVVTEDGGCAIIEAGSDLKVQPSQAFEEAAIEILGKENFVLRAAPFEPKRRNNRRRWQGHSREAGAKSRF